ncbi:hypothetical protein [Xylanimonas protaetiae]|uniref:Uncharacterized protein n=1 Tax=Xylanimonas protaetiae TaxID=2509457 RepID=A0A4P6FH65_9MICO|nr:hypothetical protein [Xylanimonas protaetiae]QAY69968.1 hypothetical protein ET471_07930 [Xylanimonas protaetiae]
MLMIIKVEDGTAIVCEEHEIAAVVKQWVPEYSHEAADVLQFAYMRGEDTRRREFALGIAIRS